MENTDTAKNSIIHPIHAEVNDLNLNHSIKLSDHELKEYFDKHRISSLSKTNKQDYLAFCKEICEKTNNSGMEHKLLEDFDFDKLHQSVLNVEYSQIHHHLSHHNRIVKKDLIDFSDEARPASYASRIGIILRKLPALTAKAKAAAYASEVGESFRPVVHNLFVRSMYGISIGYVLFDIAGRTYCVHDQGKEAMSIFAFDTTLFHLMASLIFPALVIHKIVSISSKMVKKRVNNVKIKAWLPAAIALASVPFIIEPIDHITEFILDKGVRPFYIDKIAKEANKLH